MTGKKYLKRKRILGVSAIVLAMLLMALPVFSRASEIPTLQNGYGINGAFTGTNELYYAEDSKQGELTQIIWDDQADSGTVNISSTTGVPVYIKASDDYRTIYVHSSSDSLLANENCDVMFKNNYHLMDNCSNIDGFITRLDTSNVTSMQEMFCGCKALTQLDVSRFRTINVRNMKNMFYECSALTELDVSGFDTSNVEDMDCMFASCSSLSMLDVSRFNTEKVNTMNSMFCECSALTELDVSGFDTSNVEDMNALFGGCASLTGLDLSCFDTTNVRLMSAMFKGCSSLTELDLTNFDTPNVESMLAMFDGCSSLTELDVSNFDTSNVEDMGSMFNGCSALTELDVSGFDTSSAEKMGGMFAGCASLTELDMSNFVINAGTRVGNMFNGCTALETIKTPTETHVEIDLPGGENWYELTDGTYGDTAYTKIPDNLTASITLVKASAIPKTAKLKKGSDIRTAIESLYSDTERDGAHFGEITKTIWSDDKIVDGLDISEGIVISTADSANPVYVRPSSDYKTLYVYSEANKIYTNEDSSTLFFSNYPKIDSSVCLYDNREQIDNGFLGKLDTTLTTNMMSMFNSNPKVTALEVSGFDTSKVTNMNSMFAGNPALTSLDLTRFDTSKVTDMGYMFNNDAALTALDVSSFDTSSVSNMEQMFCDCKNITSLDLSNFVVKSGTNVYAMLVGCEALETVKSPKETHVEIVLPQKRGYAWYKKLDDGSYGTDEYEKIPGNLTESITLVRREKGSAETTQAAEVSPSPSPVVPTPTLKPIPTVSNRSLTIVDNRADKTGTEQIKASVSNLVGNLKLIIEDDDGADIKKIQPLTKDQTLIPYNIYIVDENGNRYNNFGSFSLILPVPDSLDLTQGDLKVLAAPSSNVLERVPFSKLVQNNINCVQLTATSVGEYGLLYTPKAETTTAVTSPTPSVTTSPTPSTTKSATPNPSTTKGASGGSSGSSDKKDSSSSSSSSNSKTANPVSGVKGYSNAKDMPKTGDGDVFRILCAMILFLFGSIELISSIREKTAE